MSDEKFEPSGVHEDDSLSEFFLEEEEVEQSLADSLSQEEIEQLIATYWPEAPPVNIKNILEEAPEEITTNIFTWLPIETLLALSLTNTHIAELAKDNVLWKMKFEQYFPHRVNGLAQQSTMDWYKKFREVYASEIALWPKESRKIAEAIIRADRACLEKMNLGPEILSDVQSKTPSLFDLAKKIGNQSVLDFFYQHAKKQYLDGEKEIQKKDSEGRTLFYWLIVCNQGINEFTSLKKQIASQLNEPCQDGGIKPIQLAAREGRLHSFN